MPKIRCENHQKVKVGQTIVEFIDGCASVSDDVADVLLSLFGGDNQPEYFLVEEPGQEKQEESGQEKQEESGQRSKLAIPQQKPSFDKTKGLQQRGR